VQSVPPLLSIDPDVERRQRASLEEVRRGRDESAAAAAIDAVRDIARSPEGSVNAIPALVDAAKAYVTLGEMVGALKQAWGAYVETPAF
jgi:methylmalonyl-CoA mutase N-terminal domain/subunit